MTGEVPNRTHEDPHDAHYMARGHRSFLGRMQKPLLNTWRCAKRLCCRLDVCWTFAFFLLLVIIGAITTAVTQTLIARALLDTLHDCHSTRLATVLSELSGVNERARYIAASTLSLHLQDAPQLNSEANLRFLTSTLDKFPDTRFDRVFMYSLRTLEGVGTGRAVDPINGSVVLGGYYSQDTIVKYMYLINRSSYVYSRPLQIVGEWPVSRQNLSQTTPVIYGNVPVLKLAPAYYNGSIDTIDPQLFWQNAIPIPHLQFYYLPYGVVARGQPLPPGRYVDDFIIVCVDGSKFLTAYGNMSDGTSAATFIRATLGDAHPKLYSNNWGQPAVINDSAFAPIVNASNAYVDTTTITDPLMRAALRHVDLKAMKVTGYTHTADFEYKGAYATVTANTHLTSGGLVIAIVLASAQNDVTKDYLTVLRICNCITAVAIVLFTALFWWFVHNEYSRPLEDMTKLLLQSVQTGRRATLRLTRRTFIQLSESAQLIRAFNDCVRRLREIDAFIPEDVRRLFLQRQRRLSIFEGSISYTSLSSEMATMRSTRRRDTLRPHHVTMAHVTVRAWTAHAGAEAAAAAVAVDTVAGGAVALQGGGARRGQRLAAVVERAAHAGGVANSGAFASAAAVAAFSAAVHELAAQHGGLVRNLTPDGCVVHFMAAVCAHLPRHGGAERGGGAEYDPAPLRACIDADAYAGLAFALALQRWVDARSAADTAGTAAAPAMPDVRCLVDTGVYTCGQYRAPGSEQTLTVALGRDAQRVVGRAAALLGVRVAMTEETAVRVRPGPRAATEPGVRQLPVEALRTGRAGLDADAVILYEVLPGAAAGDAAWLAYVRCCFDGFECMVRGDYAGALRAYRGVGEVGDLEPGLLPRCLSREAAHSDAVGGAVSVQVQRMMAECERRERLHITTGYHREARSPLGIDAVLRGMPLEMRVCVGSRGSMCSFASASNMSSGRRRTGLPRSLRVLSGPDTVRMVVAVPTARGECRCVIGRKPDVIVDNFGTSWLLSRRSFEESPMEPWRTHCFALSSAGAICIASFLPFRELQPLLTKAIAGAPCGPMSDALRSAVPVHDATAKQRRAVDHLCVRRQHLDHPNLLRYSSYSLSVEGGLVMMKTFAPGGTLRQVLRRYPNISFMARARFALSILSGLAYLHANGCVHGAVSVDSIVVCGDGQCRLRGYFVDYALAEATFLLPCTCYVSPAMAAGNSPTPECDVFCYGLLWIEGLSGKRPWRWAWNRDGEPVGTEQELEELIEEGGQRFCAAVDEGRVVVAKELMELACVKRLLPPIAWNSVMRCISSEASDRPTSLWLFLAMKELVGEHGAEVEEDTDSERNLSS